MECAAPERTSRCRRAAARWISRPLCDLLLLSALAALCWGLMSGLGGGEGGGQRAQQRAVVATTVVMAGLWITGAAHMAVVALLPVALYPVLGVASGKEVATQYFSNTVFVLVGSVLLALALESTAVHKRAALKLLSVTPSSPSAFLASFMAVSAALSSIMSNTATCSIVCPMAVAVHDELAAETAEGSPREADPEAEIESGTTEAPAEGEAEASSALRPFFGRVMLGVAYSCTMGGLTTKTGTGTNLAFAAAYEELAGGQIGYARWLAVGVPVSLLLLCCCWTWLSFAFGGTQLPSGYSIPTASLAKSYAALGPATRDQKVVLLAVALTVALWIAEPSKWGVAALEGVTDATVVMAIVLLLFFVPSSEHQGSTVLDWRRIHAKIPFDLFLLVGVGGVISKAFESSGLTLSIGESLRGLDGVRPDGVALIVMAVAASLSSFMSDVATANILLPIMHALAGTLKQDPLVFMVPTTLACSMAFLLPISTPPNAIVMSTGFVRTRDFLQHGGFLVVAGLLVIEGVCFSFGLRALGA